MKETTNIPGLIEEANKNDWLQVFLINNPVSAIISRMIIDAYEIQTDNVMAVSLRKTDTSLVDASPFVLSGHWSDRFLIKLFKDKPISRRVLKPIDKKGQNFILYTAWAFRESISTPSIKKILTSNYCMGHLYIEEGQMTYRPSKPYSATVKKRHHSRYAENLKDVYRDDAHGFIGILPDAFPAVQEDKRFILDNYEDLKKYYKPSLTGVKTIGLTCAERRLRIDQWEPMLKKLVKNMPHGGVIKLHPSFTSDISKKKKMESMLARIAPESISLCSDKVIVEIEMLYEPKTLIGSLTSLSKYAEALGSEFIDIPLY